MLAPNRRSTSAKWTKAGTNPNGQSNGYDYTQSYPRSQNDHMYLHPEPHMSGNNSNNHPGNMSPNPLSILTENMNRMNIAPTSYHQQPNTKSNPAMNSQSYDGGVPLSAGMPQAFVHNGQLIFAGSQYPATAQQTMAPGYGMYSHYVPQPIMSYTQPMMGSHSPMPSTWAPSSRVPSGEVPSLVTPRRAGSASSQENDVPGTPFTHFTGYGGDFQAGGGVAVVDRSPHSMYGPAWGSPSPTTTNYSAKHQQKASIPNRLHLLIQQEPAIPRAIPAPYSPVKPLDRSLENPHGITNVYIRGLLPETTDEMLFKLAGRFGDIVSSKSIIDHATGLCKGFGFVKFHNFKDAEDCIRGFHYLGYESSFARESFYSQLKKLHDDDNTNLYVSNLPKDMNEHELSAIFGKYKVCSSRILRDTAGNGRGVGFARFESRDICEDIIKDYNNTPIRKGDGEEHLIQIRFADTPDQKHLKQQTAAARSYRTAEYESQTKGFTSPARGPGNLSGDQDFEHYMRSAVGQRGEGSFPTRERLSTPHDSVIHVNLSANASPQTPQKQSPIKRSPEKRVVSFQDDKIAAGELSCPGEKSP